MKLAFVSAMLALACGAVLAKLPAPDPAAKAKADETAAKAAWQTKVDAYQLCKAQDKVAAAYKKTKGMAMAQQANTATLGASGPPQPAASGTPVASAPPPPCKESGPFAYNSPQQQPLETSEAHSPAGTATGPPSVRPHSGEIAPGSKN